MVLVPCFAQSNTLTILILAVLVLMIATLMIRSHRYLSRQKRGQSAAIVEMPRPAQDDDRKRLDAPPEVARWEVQMHETARELSSRLDSKMSVLQRLTAEADRAAARLEAALGQAPHAPDTAEPTPNDQAEPPETASTNQRREEIYTLADYGLPAAEIARRTGAPVGEIELILGLRGQE